MSENMNIHQEPKQTPELEGKLETLYSAITPDPAFAHRLEAQLAERSQQLYPQKPPKLESWIDRMRAIFRRPALAAGLIALAVLVLAISLAGPQRVVAEVQRLLGFVPGSGFVQPGETRLLPATVDVTQGDVTLHIEKVIATNQGTEISLTASGLPREKFGPPSGPEDQFGAYLLLPDGQRLALTSSLSGMGDTLQASLYFGPLPEGIASLTLVLPRLPGLPAGFAPENWSIPLQLQVVGSTQAAPGTLPAANAYAPNNSLASANGASVQVVQVAQTAEETGIQLQYHWQNQDWKWLQNVQMELSDQAGRVYPLRREDMQSSLRSGDIRSLRFDPFDSQAAQATLKIEQMSFSFSSPAHFTFDPGQAAQAGQTWDLASQPGAQMQIAGVPVQVLSVSISEGKDEGQGNSASQAPHYHLSVLVQSTPTGAIGLGSLAMSTDPERMVSSSTEILPGNQMRLTIDLPEIPTRPLTLYFPYGDLTLNGPWQITWDLQK